MSVVSHLDTLHQKHALLESMIEEEAHRPLPDFARMSDLKKQKLKLKEEILALASHDEAA